jgi:hypothetical protein
MDQGKHIYRIAMPDAHESNALQTHFTAKGQLKKATRAMGDPYIFAGNSVDKKVVAAKIIV